MAITCGTVTPSPIFGQIPQIVDQHELIATQMLGLVEATVRSFMGSLQDIQGLTLDYNLSWNDPGLGGPWSPPNRPPNFAGQFNPPQDVPDVELNDIPDPILATYPSGPSTPSFDTSGLPAPWTGTIPTDIPDVGEVVLPDLVMAEFPVVPELTNIPLPQMEPIVYPTFDGVKPDTAIRIPDFPEPPAETPYSSEMLMELQAQIISVLQGSRGYLDVVWDMIWEREYWNEANAAKAAAEATMELWASRGWPVPGGVEAQQLLDLEQKVMGESMKRAREIAIEQNKAEVERFNFFVAQGIALETQLINLHSQSADRLLRATELSIRSAEALVQARVSIVNIQLEAYKTDAQVYRDKLQGELAKVQVFSEQIKAASLIGEIDARKIQLYTAQLDGIQKQVQIYLGQMDGVKVQLDVARLKVQVAVERINAVKTQLEAKKLEYDGYDSKIRGQLGIANIYQTEGQVFLARTQAISAQNDGKLKLFDARIRENAFLLEKLKAELQRYEVQYKGEVDKFDAFVKLHGTEVQLYDSQVKGEIGRMSGEAEKYKALTERARAEETIKLQIAQIGLQQISRALELESAGLEKIMTTYAGIGSAALAALNVHAGMSVGQNESISQSFDYQCN